MGTYTGTDGDDTMYPGFLSDGVVADPLGTTPGDGPDTLIGNGGNDILDGGEGDDSLYGGEGDDSLHGVEGNNWLFGDEGDDYLSGSNDGDDRLIGGEGDDVLFGSNGYQIGRGSDIMEGGAGDDLYVIDNLSQLVIEDTDGPSGGVDEVESWVSYTLGFGLENLELITSGNIDGTGNSLDNTIEGYHGNNVLKGGRGDDVLVGDRGNDELIGGKGDDHLNGGKNGDDGRDLLSGGRGDDTFLFDTRSGSGDRITDFEDIRNTDDRILIRVSAFKGGLEAEGHLARDQFQISAGHQAHDRDVRFIFDTRDATLWYDENGNKDGRLSLVADLQASAAVEHNDIWLI